MLLDIKRMWVEESTDPAPSGYGERHELSEHVSDDSEEHSRHNDRLRFEVIDSRDGSSEERKTGTCNPPTLEEILNIK